eukprot:COSAG01_NODE_5762_length_4048_cov_3.069385_2_plen_38_part_00
MSLVSLNRDEWNEDGQRQYVPYGPIISTEIEAASMLR